MAAPDNIQSSSIAIWGFLGALVTFLIVMVLQVLFFWQEGEQQAANEAQAPRAARELLQTQDAQLSGYAWADKGRQVVRIPIERAIELIVAERKTAAAQRD